MLDVLTAYSEYGNASSSSKGKYSEDVVADVHAKVIKTKLTEVT